MADIHVKYIKAAKEDSRTPEDVIEQQIEINSVADWQAPNLLE